MTDNNPTPDAGHERTAEERDDAETVGGVPNTPALSDEQLDELSKEKSEIASLIEYGSNAESKDAIDKWFAREDDTRSETWVSRNQAIAMSHVANADDIYAHHKYDYDFSRFEKYIDDIRHHQISLDGIGRDQQMRVLGAVMASARQPDGGGDGDGGDGGEKTLRQWH